MVEQIDEFEVGQLYSIQSIQEGLGVGNAGGVRLSLSDSGDVRRAVVLTAPAEMRQAKENPYHDRVEDDVLVYTGAGLEGNQLLSGVNKRFPQQLSENFPIYAFSIIASRRDRNVGVKRWRFLGLLEYIRHYADSQVDSRGSIRTVWIFEFRIHSTPQRILLSADAEFSADMLARSRAANPPRTEDREIASVGESARGDLEDPVLVEARRARLLASDPRQFEHFVKEILILNGFERASVTRFSQDGGIDVNAYAGPQLWPLRATVVALKGNACSGAS